METVISYMEKRLKEYNETLSNTEKVGPMTTSQCGEALAARNELMHLLDYTKKVGPISK